MSEAKITEQLRLLLDEVEFVYHHLPKTLERARKVSRGERWNVFFGEQADQLRIQREALRATAEGWGRRTRPCFCTAVEMQLNEARLAVTDRRAKPMMEKTVQAVLEALRTRVVSCLDEAIDLALRIREHDLAEQLRSLVHDERSHQRVAEVVVAAIRG